MTACNCDDQSVAIERTGDLTTITCLTCGRTIVKDNLPTTDERDARAAGWVLLGVSGVLIVGAVAYQIAGSASGVIWCAFSAAACAGLAPVVRRWGRA